MDARQFIMQYFYVDAGLVSFPSDEEAISTLKKTKGMLAESNIKLQKCASKSHTVMETFSCEDVAKELKHLDLSADSVPLQRRLGLSWNLQADSFTFWVSHADSQGAESFQLSVAYMIPWVL